MTTRTDTTLPPIVSTPSPWGTGYSYLRVLLADGTSYSEPINPASSSFEFPEEERGCWHEAVIREIKRQQAG